MHRALLDAASSCLVIAIAVATPVLAHAHGGRPQTQAVLFVPDAPGRMVVEATFGLLTSDDGGASWAWTCQESIPDGVAGAVQPAVLATGDRLLIAGTFGLVRGARAGCAWDRDPGLDGHYVADVVRDPGGALLAITGDSGAEDNGLWESTDDGRSFSRTGAPFPLRFLSERVRVAPSDPRRIYVSGQRYVEGTTMISGVLLRSDDRGATWTELPIAVGPDDRLVRIAEVDPSDPDLAWIVVQGSESDRVLRVSGGGTVVDEVLAVLADPMPYQRPFALARAPDGTIWFGNTREGLSAIAPDGTVTLVDKYLAVACAVVHEGWMYLCANGTDDGFAVGRTALGAAYAPEPIVRFGEIARRECGTPVDCLCTGWWDDFQLETTPDAGVEQIDGGTCVEPDAGTDASAMDAGTHDGGTIASPSSGCGCRAGGRAPRSPWILVAAVAVMFGRRRRGAR